MSVAAHAQYSNAWQYKYDVSPGYNSVPVDMALDSSGSLIVLETVDGPTNSDIAVLKIDPAGNLIWKRTWDDASHLNERAVKLALGPSDSVYVIATAGEFSQSSKIAILGWDYVGNAKFATTFGYHAGQDNVPTDLKVDSSGNCYVAGTMDGPSGQGMDMVLISCSSAGTINWYQEQDGVYHGDDLGGQLVRDAASGTIYHFARTATGPGEQEFWVGAYNANGVLIRSTVIDPDPQDPQTGIFPTSILMNKAGDLYLVSSEPWTSTTKAMYLAKLASADLSMTWQETIYALHSVYATVAKLDSKENLVIAGTDSPTNQAFACEKYDPKGALLAKQLYTGSMSSDCAYALELDSRDNCYFGGDFTNGSGLNSIVRREFGAEDNYYYTLGNNSWNRAVALKIDTHDNLYMAAQTNVTNSGNFVLVLTKILQSPVAVDDTFTCPLNTAYSPNAATGVLSNDAGIHGTAILVANAQQGNLTLNSDGSFTYKPKTGFSGDDKFTYKINSIYGYSNVATVTLKVRPHIKTAVFNPNTLVGGHHVNLTLTLDAAASVGSDVQLLASDNFVHFPATYTIPAGQTTGVVDVAIDPVGANKTVTFTATLNGQVAALLHVLKPAMTDLYCPSTVVGGDSFFGTVELNGAAPKGGIIVPMSSQSSIITFKVGCPIAEGSAGGQYQGYTVPVSASATRDVTASLDGVTKTKYITVMPGGFSDITVNPSTVPGGVPVTGTIHLTGPAPNGGELVYLASNSPVLVPPSSVMVLEGHTTVDFVIQTKAVATTSTRAVKAVWNNIQKSVAITLTPAPALTGLSANPTTFKGGSSSTGTVTIASAAPTGGLPIPLSANSGVLHVPATVTVPAGATTANFTITSSAVAATYVRTVSASFNGVTKTVSLTITP